MENLDKSLRVLTYYHTSIRNIGLYTSLAFASLVYSRFHRGKTFFNSEGEPIRMVGTHTDITKLKESIPYRITELYKCLLQLLSQLLLFNKLL